MPPTLNLRAKLRERLFSGVTELGVVIDSAQGESLLDYIELLARWNTAYNLTAVRDTGEMVTRHLLDSLAIAPHVRGQTLVDLGTGAGLPGIPLAILDPQRSVTLVDSNGKKISFLREATRLLKLTNVRVEQARVEQLQGSFDCVVARAFASVGDFLRVGGHLLAAGGRCLAMKGVVDKSEILGLPDGFTVSQIVALTVPGLGAARHVVIITRSGGESESIAPFPGQESIPQRGPVDACDQA